MHLNEVFLTIIYKMLLLGKISTIFFFPTCKILLLFTAGQDHESIPALLYPIRSY